MVAYGLAKVYAICCNLTGLKYYGSTTLPLEKRLSGHKGAFKAYQSGKSAYMTSFRVLEGGNYDIVLVADFPCETVDELRAEEYEYIKNNDCVNKAGRFVGLNYYAENRERQVKKQRAYDATRKEAKKEYYQANREERLAYQRVYRHLKNESKLD